MGLSASGLADVSGAAEAEDEAADGAGDEEQQTGAEALAEGLGQLKALHDMDDRGDQAHDRGRDDHGLGRVLLLGQGGGQGEADHVDNAHEAAPADGILRADVDEGDERKDAGPAGLAEDLPVGDHLQDIPQDKDADHKAESFQCQEFHVLFTSDEIYLVDGPGRRPGDRLQLCYRCRRNQYGLSAGAFFTLYVICSVGVHRPSTPEVMA